MHLLYCTECKDCRKIKVAEIAEDKTSCECGKTVAYLAVLQPMPSDPGESAPIVSGEVRPDIEGPGILLFVFEEHLADMAEMATSGIMTRKSVWSNSMRYGDADFNQFAVK